MLDHKKFFDNKNEPSPSIKPANHSFHIIFLGCEPSPWPLFKRTWSTGLDFVFNRRMASEVSTSELSALVTCGLFPLNSFFTLVV